MALTALNPNLLGTDSAGASKLSTAGGLVQLHSTGVFTIANTSANSFHVANTGAITFAGAASGITTLAAGNTTLTGTLDVASRGITKGSMPAGSALQVVQITKTDTFSTSSTTMTDITGLSVSITPSSASNKILVFMNASVSGGDGNDINHVGIQIVRDSTAIFIGDVRGTRMRGTSIINGAIAGQMYHPSAVYLDSPATTSAITYKLQIKTTNASYTANINRSGRDLNNAIGYDGTGTSGITVMEIAG